MLKDLKCVNENVGLKDYLFLYKYVRDNMEHPEWLGTFTESEIIDILNDNGKIWLYYDNDKLVCSMFYIPVKEKTLIKHNIHHNSKDVGSLGPIMVSPNYVGNGYQGQMMQVLEDYCKQIGKKYIFTKVCTDNIYSLNNLIKDNYQIINRYINDRGENTALLKKID